MEDDKIKTLFDNYRPDLPSDSLFMASLARRMNAVEIVREHQEAMKRRNRRAGVLAAAAGFAAGALCSWLVEPASAWIATFSISLPHIQAAGVTADLSSLMWATVAAVSAATSMSVYRLAAARQS